MAPATLFAATGGCIAMTTRPPRSTSSTNLKYASRSRRAYADAKLTRTQSTLARFQSMKAAGPSQCSISYTAMIALSSTATGARYCNLATIGCKTTQNSRSLLQWMKDASLQQPGCKQCSLTPCCQALNGSHACSAVNERHSLHKICPPL